MSSFDFSTDSGYLQSNDGVFDLLFSNDFGEYMAQATALKDVDWASQTCTLGWGVKGLWPKINDGTMYTASDRSFEGVGLHFSAFVGACVYLQPVVNDTFLPRGKLLCSLPREPVERTSKHRAAQVRG